MAVLGETANLQLLTNRFVSYGGGQMQSAASIRSSMGDEDEGERSATEGSSYENQSNSAPSSVICDPACFIISHSISKKHNLGTVARSATAFGVKEVSVCIDQTRYVECKPLGHGECSD